MKRLTTKKYWDEPYKNSAVTSFNSSDVWRNTSFYMIDFYKQVAPYIKKNSRAKIIEIGCAPGNHILALAKKFKLEPYGVEYTDNGCKLTKKNFVYSGFNPNNVIRADFFSEKFQKAHRQKYDIVFSMGFIEHFNNPEHVIRLHNNLLKKGGILILTVPNLFYWNKHFFSSAILNKHNLTIMTLPAMRKISTNEITIKSVEYFGGPINLGLYKFHNPVLEFIRFVLFILQRLSLDIFLWLCSLFGINMNNRWLSPSIMLIGYKK